MYFINCEISNFCCGSRRYYEWHKVVFAKVEDRYLMPLSKKEADDLSLFLVKEKDHFKEIQAVLQDEVQFDLYDPIREKKFLWRGVLEGVDGDVDSAIDKIRLLNSDRETKAATATGLHFSTVGLFRV